MKVVILQSNYLPWKGYFDLIHDADAFVFYDDVKYTKNDWRNRNQIYSKNGKHWLTVPISKEAVKLKINEVKFRDSSWQDLHYKTLSMTYKKAPYFLQLEELLHEFYRRKTWESLSDFNQFTIRHLSQYLGLTTVFRNSSEFSIEGKRVERLLNILKQLDASMYISGPSAHDYLTGKETLFQENNIQLVYKDYHGYPAYNQFNLPFENLVSVVDLIAHVKRDDIPYYIWGWRS